MPAKQGAPKGAVITRDKAEARRSAATECERFGLDRVIEMLSEGKGYRATAREIGISTSALWQWIRADDKRYQACARAREDAAAAFDEMAEQRIDEAADPFELAKAKEIAVHLRWRAKAVNPRTYGDKTLNEVSGPGGGAIPVNVGLRFVDADGKDRGPE